MRIGKQLWLGVGVVCSAVGAGGGLAAAQSSGGIDPTPDRGAEIRRAGTVFAAAIIERRDLLSRGRFSAIPPFGAPAAVSTRRLAGFPIDGRSFGILSTGNANDADNKNNNEGTSASLGGPSIRGARDVVIQRTTVRVPRGASCLSIRFRFLTEEYPEFVKEEYNDAFIAELDKSNWSAGTKEQPQVIAPNNFAFDAGGRPINVNSLGTTSLRRSRARGTTYDGATRRLRASVRVTPGRHILYLSIFDQGDRQYDSAVFVDELSIDRRNPCRGGAVPDNR